MGGYEVSKDNLLANLPRTAEGLPRAGSVVIHDMLGEGGMGAVYLGFDENLAVEVAVKVLPFKAAKDATSVERFFREARSTFKVDHQNVVRVLTVAEEAGTYYLVMEFVDGESADQRVRREGPLPERDALEIVIAAGEALAAAHAKGILHRDVKPANIMIRFEDGRVKVADLGLAKALGSEAGGTTGLTATGQMLGTPAFMSPEQATDASRADEKTDIYSLGATLYALLSGKAPFEATQLYSLLQKVVNEKPPDLYEVRPDVSARTGAAESVLMAKDPGKRPQTMSEAVLLLRGCLEAAPAEGARGLSRPQMTGRRKLGIAVKERTPTPAAPRTLDDVTSSKVARGRIPTRRADAPVTAGPTGGKKVAIVLAVLAALGAAGGAAAYVYSQRRAADLRSAEEESKQKERSAEERRREDDARKKRQAERAAAEAKKREEEAGRAEEERKKKQIKSEAASRLKTAQSFQEAGLLDKARDEVVEALNIIPDHAEAKRFLVQVQSQISARQAEVERSAERSAELNKCMDEGLRLRLADKLQEAAAAYERARASDPAGNAGAAQAAAECLQQHYRAQAVGSESRGDYERAVAFYAQALAKKDDPATRAALAEAKKKLGAKRAEEAQKAEAARWRKRAEGAERRSDLKAALGYYREAQKLGADVGKKISSLEAELRYREAMGRARSHMEEQDWSGAKRALEQALARKPGDQEATKLIAEAERRSRVRPRRVVTEGKVLSVSAETKLVMLSVGRNDHVRPGDRFTISRGAAYVGKVEVKKAFDDMAVAHILRPWTKQAIRPGDDASLVVDDSPADSAGMQPASPALTIDLGGGVKMAMVYIKPGRFMMGSDGGMDDGKPVQEVAITSGFYLSKYEVTQGQYERVMGTNPSEFEGTKDPVQRVMWNEAVDFCRRLSERTGRRLRLPTEAEWEYACRAGSTGKYCSGSDEADLDKYAWHGGNSGMRTHPVGQKRANAWGFHDMPGNITEWCNDWYDAGYYENSPREDPKGPAAGTRRVLRGGSWQLTSRCCQSANRDSLGPASRNNIVGFRVALDP